MISSMTGFGRAAAELDNITITIEIRSVNNRFCEVLVRSPKELNRWETEIQNMVKKAFARGRINVQVQLERKSEELAITGINRTAAREYGKLLKQLKKISGISDRPRIADLLQFPDIFERNGAAAEDETVIWKVTEAALTAAIDEMAAMRRTEGTALKRDLLDRIGDIERYAGVVETRSPNRVQEARARLKERLEELAGDERLNPERLELEIALVADKLDVTEEVVRLRSHVEQFREALSGGGQVGRKLNFISQEMNREVNTIGSKANDAELTRTVVSMKEELEKIREQVENVE
ncbi:MAG: YicC/YloC family endoribonuclease [Rhodothermales bacterium]